MCKERKLGVKRQGVWFWLCYVLVAMGHPSGNISQVVRVAGLNGRGEFRSGEIELGVSSIEMILKSMRFEEITQEE